MPSRLFQPPIRLCRFIFLPNFFPLVSPRSLILAAKNSRELTRKKAQLTLKHPRPSNPLLSDILMSSTFHNPAVYSIFRGTSIRKLNRSGGCTETRSTKGMGVRFANQVHVCTVIPGRSDFPSETRVASTIRHLIELRATN